MFAVTFSPWKDVSEEKTAVHNRSHTSSIYYKTEKNLVRKNKMEISFARLDKLAFSDWQTFSTLFSWELFLSCELLKQITKNVWSSVRDQIFVLGFFQQWG